MISHQLLSALLLGIVAVVIYRYLVATTNPAADALHAVVEDVAPREVVRDTPTLVVESTPTTANRALSNVGRDPRTSIQYILNTSAEDTTTGVSNTPNTAVEETLADAENIPVSTEDTRPTSMDQCKHEREQEDEDAVDEPPTNTNQTIHQLEQEDEEMGLSDVDDTPASIDAVNQTVTIDTPDVMMEDAPASADQTPDALDDNDVVMFDLDGLPPTSNTDQKRKRAASGSDGEMSSEEPSAKWIKDGGGTALPTSSGIVPGFTPMLRRRSLKPDLRRRK
ncbi:hypothetical protein QBC46DRAFT_402949 [Diplogelasinospora grovesii]|uniref:Uncharacterized protein n=1 Tax=Diplogelasinospora grovesii TaxID=303347 RepID=A0AAN6NLK1_9PEZI|nr:hypothetical protein QBC46DRAFT_402949 [Diplogelasinospora grovesii]